MAYSLPILRYRLRLRRVFFFINFFVCLFVFIHFDFNNTTNRRKYKSITKDLINERLRSHTRFFKESSSFCNTTESLTIEQKHYYEKVIPILPQLRQQSIPSYPNDQFNGRGIVLTVDAAQVSHYMFNLKMIEYIQTHLPVQVNFKINCNIIYLLFLSYGIHRYNSRILPSMNYFVVFRNSR